MPTDITLSTFEYVDRDGQQMVREAPMRKPKQNEDGFVIFPISWLKSIQKLSKSALLVGLALHYWSKLTKTSEVILSAGRCSTMCITRLQRQRGLKELSAKGFITIKQQGRSAPVVTLLR
jgi:hypothetical protein